MSITSNTTEWSIYRLVMLDILYQYQYNVITETVSVFSRQT